jgi:hypothetical protein
MTADAEHAPADTSRDEAIRRFDVEHEKRMHLLIARRDLTGFQHLHPTMNHDGTWSTPLRLDDAGSFVREGEATTPRAGTAGTGGGARCCGSF